MVVLSQIPHSLEHVLVKSSTSCQVVFLFLYLDWGRVKDTIVLKCSLIWWEQGSNLSPAHDKAVHYPSEPFHHLLCTKFYLCSQNKARSCGRIENPKGHQRWLLLCKSMRDLKDLSFTEKHGNSCPSKKVLFKKKSTKSSTVLLHIAKALVQNISELSLNISFVG